MARKFNEIYTTAKKTTYGELSNALVLASSMNSVVDFTPVLSPNGTNATEKYNVQVAKRNKSKSIANGASNDVNTSSSDVASMTTSDNLAILDSFGKYDWDTEEITTGVLRGIGHKIGFNDEYDADSLSQTQADFIASEVGNEAITRKEALLSEIISNGTVVTKEIDTTATVAAGTTPMYDIVTAEIRNVRKVSDDFKHRTAPANILVLVSSDVKDAIAKEIGTRFTQEAPIYKTGLNSKFSVNGIATLEVPELDQYVAGSKTTATATTGIVVLDIESVAFKAANEMKGVDVNLGATRFVGSLFYSIQKVLTVGSYKERIRIIADKGQTTKAKGVNE